MKLFFSVCLMLSMAGCGSGGGNGGQTGASGVDSSKPLSGLTASEVRQWRPEPLPLCPVALGVLAHAPVPFGPLPFSPLMQPL